MSSLASRLVLLLLITSLFSAPQPAQADEGREFLLSCTYGILAGALVGAASLAVEDDPSSKVHRVARGASLGLYTGILLGVYVVYVVPAQLEQQEQDMLDQEYEEAVEPEDYGRVRIIKKPIVVPSYQPPKLTFYPVIEQSRVTGAAVNYSVFHF